MIFRQKISWHKERIAVDKDIIDPD